jgi:16S rRNA (cytidine1402-2'-O)-methyltransferase
LIQRSFKDKKPTIFVVSTPIGNLSDMTYRAVEILKDADYIFAEDTRNSGVLLKHFNIETQMISYHEFNKDEKSDEAMLMLESGKDIAVITDAGTPGISDPGYLLIEKAIAHEFHVVPIPGASASLAALVGSGLSMQPHTFIGFLPRKKTEAKHLLETYKTYQSTLVIYESPMRISETLKVIRDILGNRRIAIARELTKTFETWIRMTLDEAIALEHIKKGEYVLVIEGYVENLNFDDISINDQVQSYIDDGLSEKDAMKKVASLRKITKSVVYKSFKINQ